MRIVSWNCYRGACLDRAERLAHLAPDIAVIQECAQPAPASSGGRAVWFGKNPRQGVGVVARPPYAVAPGPVDETLDHTAFPAIISGPVSFHLLAIWALPRPTYVRAMLGALETYADFLRDAPSVVIGDFNCFAEWQGKAPSKHHVDLAHLLRDELALVSAYHSAPAYDPSVPEAPTYFFRWKEKHPFHIDYCFVPAAWRWAIRSVSVRPFDEATWQSDHRPVIVELDLPMSSSARGNARSARRVSSRS